MFVFDLFSQYSKSSKAQRVATLGSCRIKNSLRSLLASDKSLVYWDLPPLTHTLSEANQVIRYFKGDLHVSPFLTPFVFGQSAPPSIPYGARRVIDQVDTFFVEVSESIQLRYRDKPLQQNFFTTNFIQKHGAQLLDWYRVLTTGLAIDEDLVARTIEKLAGAQVPITDDLVDLLRHTVRETVGAESIKASMKEIMFDPSRRWIFMSHFRVPGVVGAIMDNRKQLLMHLSEAAQALGAEVFDPSIFIEKYGREAVLDDGGKNVYEYSPNFVPFMGAMLSDLINGAFPHGQIGEGLPSVPHAEIKGEPDKSIGHSLAFLNTLLIPHHLDRVSALGVNESGLYEHYRLLAEQGMLARPEHVEVLKIIERILPSFDHYVVHKDGLGEFALLMALRNLSVTALEPNGARYGAMLESVRRLSQERPEVAALVTTELGSFSVHAPNPLARTLAICLDLSGTRSERDKDAMTSALARYNELLINTRLFMGIHESQESKDNILALLNSHGWKLVGEWGNNVAYFVKK